MICVPVWVTGTVLWGVSHAPPRAWLFFSSPLAEERGHGHSLPTCWGGSDAERPRSGGGEKPSNFLEKSHHALIRRRQPRAHGGDHFSAGGLGPGFKRGLDTPLIRGADGRHLRPLCLGPRPQRLGQRLLRRRCSGRHEELEGLLLRLPRRFQLHHRRQVARLPLGDGDLGATFRFQPVVGTRAAGAGRHGHGRDCLRGGA